MILKRSAPEDWLIRGDFLSPIARTHDLWLHGQDALLLALGLAWVRRRQPDLAWLWAAVASAFLLRNHQLLTGLQMQNFHWEYAFGICGSLLTALLAARELRARVGARRRVVAILAAAVALHLLSGLGLRGLEARRNRVTREIMAHYQRYREEATGPRAAPIRPGSVVAGAADFVDFAVIDRGVRPLLHGSVLVTPWIRDDEWHERIGLDAILRGLGRAAFEAEQRDALAAGFAGMEIMGLGGGFGPWTRDPARAEALIGRRLAAFDAARADLAGALRRFEVRYVALPAGSRPDYLDDGWRPLRLGPTWDIWARRTGPGAGPA